MEEGRSVGVGGVGGGVGVGGAEGRKIDLEDSEE